MREDGERLVAEGVTSPEEVMRVHARELEPRPMPAYKFEALDAAGKIAPAAWSRPKRAKAARAQLRAQQLVPLAVTPVVVGRHRRRRRLQLRAQVVRRRPAWRSGRASSPAWWARACRWSAR